MKTLTLVFENCEELSFEINHQTHFHIEKMDKGYNLDTESGEMVESYSFSKGFLMIPKNVKVLPQVGLSKFINNGDCNLQRILNYNDITSIIPPDKQVFYPKWVGCQNNCYQKSYKTEEGNILVDFGECMKNQEDIYFYSEDEYDMLQIVDAYCYNY